VRRQKEKKKIKGGGSGRRGRGRILHPSSLTVRCSPSNILRFVLLAGYALKKCTNKKKERKERRRKASKRNCVCREKRGKLGGSGCSNYDKGAKFCCTTQPPPLVWPLKVKSLPKCGEVNHTKNKTQKKGKTSSQKNREKPP